MWGPMYFCRCSAAICRCFPGVAVAACLLVQFGVCAGALEEKLAALEAARRAGILTDAEYSRKRSALTGGAAQGTPPGAPGGAAMPTKHAGQVYRHPTGVVFWYPTDWRLVQLEGILQLVPPDAGQSGQSYEAYFITGERIAGTGITQASDPQVIAYLDEKIVELGQELGVFFRRKGVPRSVPVSRGAGQGVRVDWCADSQVGPLHAYAVACLVGDYGLVIAGVGAGDRALRRESSLMRIAASFGAEGGKLDPRLVGTWRLRGSYAVQNESSWETAYSRAKTASESESTLVLRPDGTWTRQDRFQMIAGAGGVWLEGGDSSASTGHWNAGSGWLFMLWRDASFADYRYRVEGNELHLLAEGKGETWVRGD